MFAAEGITPGMQVLLAGIAVFVPVIMGLMLFMLSQASNLKDDVVALKVKVFNGISEKVTKLDKTVTHLDAKVDVILTDRGLDIPPPPE